MSMQTSRTTTDHEEIRRWAEERGGRPATGGEPGVLRFDVNEPEDSLEEISWDDFVAKGRVGEPLLQVRQELGRAPPRSGGSRTSGG
jgi:hypothetical protein